MEGGAETFHGNVLVERCFSYEKVSGPGIAGPKLVLLHRRTSVGLTRVDNHGGEYEDVDGC
jgi:hypothetical protein